MKSLLGSALLLLLARAAGAMPVYVEGFNSNGDGTRYSVVGGGAAANNSDFWALASGVNAVTFSGQEGGDYWAGRDMNGNFGGNADPREIQLPIAPLAIDGGSAWVLQVLLAATESEWESGDPDYLRIFAIDSDTGSETLLDEFLPQPGNKTDLVSGSYGTLLNESFQSYTYAIPTSIVNLEVRFEAYSTGNLEQIGIDWIRVARGPEPGTAGLLGLGLLLLGSPALRRLGARR